jgi:hypothetical protein
MAEELLDVAQVGAALQQVRRAAVAERVRGDADVDAGGLGVGADEVLDALGVEPCPPGRDEERALARPSPARAGLP